MLPIFNLKNIVIVGMLVLMIGFSVGYYTKGKFTKAAQADAAIEAQRQTADSLQMSVKTSSAIESRVETSNEQVAAVRAAAAYRFKTKETQNDTQSVAVCPGNINWNIDVATVRLLNAARAGGAVDATDEADAAGKAPSTIGIAELTDSDIQIAGQYRELAIEHNALVDYVEALVKKQAE